MEGKPKVIELNPDNLKTNGPASASASSSSSSSKVEGYVKPKMRTREEIIAQYRKPVASSQTSAHSAALDARNKLAERGEKLDQLSMRTEELQNGAEDFASVAAELAKRSMNNHGKWWKIF